MGQEGSCKTKDGELSAPNVGLCKWILASQPFELHQGRGDASQKASGGVRKHLLSRKGLSSIHRKRPEALLGHIFAVVRFWKPFRLFWSTASAVPPTNLRGME